MSLLPQPIYRYADPAGGIVDGAIFAFAKGTNPEVLVLLQAESQTGAVVWRFGIARMTARECHVREGDREIWTALYAKYPQDVRETYFNRVTRE